jgi:predicted DNA-binding antitoxin AbrB/MazE fold protein
MRLTHPPFARTLPQQVRRFFAGRGLVLNGRAFPWIAFGLRPFYGHFMISTVEAIYEAGVLRPLTVLPLQERALVQLVIHVPGDSAPVGADLERAEWLKQAERTLLQAWSNDEDDVYNALLTQ